jgi:putative endonuclease
MSGSGLGAWGESAAARHLEGEGWRVVERNYRVHRHEVDLIAERDGTFVFVEVKTRHGEQFGHPLEAISASKRRAIEQVASGWMAVHGGADAACRFDAIAVTLRRHRRLHIHHLENAWGC